MTTKTFLTAACIFASAIVPSLASAASTSEATETRVAVVRTADLNLASAEGQSTLEARIAGAVNRVCGTATGTISMDERRAITVCRTKARSAAFAVAKMRQDQMLAQR